MPDIDRFLDAQDRPPGGYATALAEIRAGRKRSHWIWYIFPQLLGLGSSPMAQLYGISDLEEARQYASHPRLGERLREITTAALGHLEAGARIEDLMGGEIDARKLVSSMTLFAAVAQDEALRDACERVLTVAETQGCERCAFTLRAVS